MKQLTIVILMGFSALFASRNVSAETAEIKIGADLRYRHETIDEESKVQRNRERIRARINLSSELSDDITMAFQIASGSDDPISTNQDLDDGFSSKKANIDLAYFTWKCSRYEAVSFSGGKMKNPFRSPSKTELIWDSDLNPEGIAVAYEDKSAAGLGYFVTMSYLWADERKAGNDALLLGAQAGIEHESVFGKLLLGAGYYDYQNVAGMATLFDSADSFGNSVDAGGAYRYDYDELEVFGTLNPAALPKLAVFADFVMNAADKAEDNIGYLAGLAYGKCKEPGSHDFQYTYRAVEKDAVIGAFTDSDFIGGSTDGSGHEINFNYQVTDKAIFGMSYFYNRIGIDNGKAYHRLMVDMNFKL